MSTKNYQIAAIDVGSNAARLLVTEVNHSNPSQPILNKLNLVRVPLRLGMEVFETQKISAKKTHTFINTIKAFSYLMQAYDVSYYNAYATSAMREAKNGAEVVEKIYEETGIRIEIIDGDTEAGLVFENNIEESIVHSNQLLYIDVGGGSTEITLKVAGKIIYNHSFDIGTIRILKNTITKDDWRQLKTTIKEQTKNLKHLKAVGSGGNINKVFSLSKKKENTPLTYSEVTKYYHTFKNLTVDERKAKYHFSSDRADVIVPALEIYTKVMSWAKINEIYVPQIGVVDGITKKLFHKVQSKHITRKEKFKPS